MPVYRLHLPANPEDAADAYESAVHALEKQGYEVGSSTVVGPYAFFPIKKKPGRPPKKETR